MCITALEQQKIQATLVVSSSNSRRLCPSPLRIRLEWSEGKLYTNYNLTSLQINVQSSHRAHIPEDVNNFLQIGWQLSSVRTSKGHLRA